MPWVATKVIEAAKFTVSEGMPIPYQRHAGFREQLKKLYGKDCVRWVEEMGADVAKKYEIELTILRKENARLKAQNAQLQGKASPKPPASKDDSPTVN